MESARNWPDLPRDVAAAIMRRVGAVDVLMSAQYVCTAWRGICRDPSMWCHVDMLFPEYDKDFDASLDYGRLCRLAVDLAQGGLVGIGIDHFADEDLLFYIAERSSQLKHLELASCYKISDVALASVAAKIPLLEDLAFSDCNASWRTIEVLGRCCPLLKMFKLVDCGGDSCRSEDEDARAIAKNMHGLVRLQIYGNTLTNAGLEAIIDGCPHLESLDLRQCVNLDLSGHLGKRCAERIKDLRLPDDPTDEYDYLYGDEYDDSDGSMDDDDSDASMDDDNSDGSMYDDDSDSSMDCDYHIHYLGPRDV